MDSNNAILRLLLMSVHFEIMLTYTCMLQTSKLQKLMLLQRQSHSDDQVIKCIW